MNNFDFWEILCEGSGNTNDRDIVIVISNININNY